MGVVVDERAVARLAHQGADEKPVIGVVVEDVFAALPGGPAARCPAHRLVGDQGREQAPHALPVLFFRQALPEMSAEVVDEARECGDRVAGHWVASRFFSVGCGATLQCGR